jgi:hypothetical protein
MRAIGAHRFSIFDPLDSRKTGGVLNRTAASRNDLLDLSRKRRETYD